MNSRLFEWIWHIKGSLTLSPGQTSEEALDRLAPLFRQTGTSHERGHGTLTFRKKDPVAQDKMSIFDGGVLEIERGTGGLVLRYHLVSRALLYCFLAPLLFLGFAQLSVMLGQWEKSSASAAKEAAKSKDEDSKKSADVPMHWIDKALGAPEPEKKEDAKDKSESKGPSPKPGYVFAGIFAALYVAGRILEERLVKSLFRKTLSAEDTIEATRGPEQFSAST